MCKDGVEDIHVVAKCNAYQEQRRVVQEKLSLRELLLGMEQFVEMFGSKEKNKKQWRVIGRFVVAILSRRKELLTRI